MPAPEQEQQFLFTGLAPGREGAQCAFAVRALSYIFHGWSHYKGGRKQVYGRPDNGVLTLIPFEKLGLFWCQLWQQLWNLDGTRACLQLETFTNSASMQDKIRWPVPFMIERAKHGKRPQRYDGVNDPTPLAEILYQQQEELGLRKFFHILPYETEGKKYPNHHKTEVHPAMPIEVRDALIKEFNAAERRYIEEIDEIIRHLGASEIRVLGTHENPEETMRDIQWEYEKMKPHVSGVVAKLRCGEPFQEDAQEILEFCDEAFRKSSSNRGDYHDAYQHFTTDLKTPILKQAFAKCHAPAANIWDGSQMTALALRSEQDWSIAKCLTAIAYFATHPDERLQARTNEAREMTHHWSEGAIGLKKHNKWTLPATLTAVYEGDGRTLNQGARDALLDLLVPLQT